MTDGSKFSAADKQCEASFVALVREAEVHLDRWRSNPHARPYQVLDLDFSQWRVSATLSDHIDIKPALTLTHFSEISEMPQAQRCAELHLSAGLYLPELAPDGARLTSLTEEQKKCVLLGDLLSLLGRIISDAPSGHPEPEAIVASYREAVSGWRDPNIVWDIVAPIANIRSDLVGRSRLDGLELRRLTDEEKARLWRTFSFPFAFGVFDVELLHGACLPLRGQYSCGRDEHVRYHVGLGITQDFLTALRLHKSGLVGVTNYFELLHCPASPSSTSGNSSYRDETITVPHWDNAYTLRVRELPQVRTIYTRLRATRVASRRRAVVCSTVFQSVLQSPTCGG